MLTGAISEAQHGSFSKSDLIEYTGLWKGERFPDGRPKVSDEILEKLKDVVIDDAILIVKKHGFNNQYDDGYVVNQEYPVLVGRAVTGVFMPLRPDVNDVIGKKAKENKVSPSPNGRVVQTLAEGDVVVGGMGKIGGTFLGIKQNILI